MLQTLSSTLYLLLLLLGFPTGLVLAYLCKEELKSWKKILIIISLISLLLSMGIYLTDFEFRNPVIVTLFFIIVVFLTIFWKSYWYSL